MHSSIHTGLTMKLTTSTVTPKHHQEVTLSCTVGDAAGFTYRVHIRRVQGRNSYSNLANFYQKASQCTANKIELSELVGTTSTFCGSGTSNTTSTSKEYGITIAVNVGEMTDYYCTIYIDYDQNYYSNFVNLTAINKVECASLNISGGGDVLTVTEGKEYDGFTCNTGNANPEPEISLKLNDTSSTDLSVRKLKSRTRIEGRLTFCSHLANDETNTFLTSINVAYVPERCHDGNYVYCSARNSEMGINEEVTSNSIRLIVQYGPLESGMTFNLAEDTYTIDESGSVTVNCSVNCKPDCTYTWTYLDRGISTGNCLHLTNITRQEAGYYKCTARNPGSGITADKYFKLYVENSCFPVRVAVGPGVVIGLAVGIVAVTIYCVARRQCAQSTTSKKGDHVYDSTSVRNNENQNEEANYDVLRP
ncbi:uncharacterized protein LOC121377712 [Gigantopelta aegis]|uniref:uncharacterized protein LOC121377712 n=1 Tax=Gigantopelta aegis TaxID=1735272 RepID=UPI001B88A07A|nr:uncharacterized protein LOC121377712 [Gigantopelta aegis]